MNLLSRGTGKELLASQHTAEPHSARRAIRYSATQNAQQSIARQFPGLFTDAQQHMGQIATAQPYAVNSKEQDYVSQTAQ